MTEDEAKTKWCFHFIASHNDPRKREWRPEDHAAGTVSPEPTGPFLHACLGSACMAWRTTREVFRNHATGALTDRDLTGNGQWIKDGFCGLAGAPA